MVTIDVVKWGICGGHNIGGLGGGILLSWVWCCLDGDRDEQMGTVLAMVVMMVKAIVVMMVVMLVVVTMVMVVVRW